MTEGVLKISSLCVLHGLLLMKFVFMCVFVEREMRTFFYFLHLLLSLTVNARYDASRLYM